MMRANPRCRASTIFTLLGSLAASVVGSQPPEAEPLEATYIEQVDVEIITVDVWVSDAEGNPVTGLEANSFAVLHDGEAATITHFTEMQAGGAAATIVTGAAREGSVTAQGFLPIPAAESHVVLYFDQTRIHPSRYPALIQSLDEFLDAQSIASERVLIMRQDRGLSVEAPFGSSRQELEQALQRLAKGTPTGLDLETETRQALQAIRDSWDQSQDRLGSALNGLAAVPSTAGQPPGGAGTGDLGTGGPRAVVSGSTAGTGPDACGMFVTQIRPTLDSLARAYRQRTGVTLTNLSSTAGFLAGLPGVKTLLYLADGLQIRPGADLATYASSLCPAASFDLLSGRLGDELSSDLLALTRHANTNRVTIYSLQTSGLRALGTGDASAGRGPRGGGGPRARGAFEGSKRAADRDGLALLATGTGGRAVFNQNDLGPDLTRIGNEIQHYYSLAYEPPPGSTGGQRRDHQIEVQVTDGAVTTRYRSGYLEKEPRQWLTERIEGALNLGITSNPLEVRLGAGTLQESSPGRYRMPLHVMVPVEHLTFLPHEGSSFADVTLRLLVRALSDSTMVIEDRNFRVERSPGPAGLADLPVVLDLAEGTHVTAIGVQDSNTREASFISTTLQFGPGG